MEQGTPSLSPLHRPHQGPVWECLTGPLQTVHGDYSCETTLRKTVGPLQMDGNSSSRRIRTAYPATVGHHRRRTQSYDSPPLTPFLLLLGPSKPPTNPAPTGIYSRKSSEHSHSLESFHFIDLRTDGAAKSLLDHTINSSSPLSCSHLAW